MRHLLLFILCLNLNLCYTQQELIDSLRESGYRVVIDSGFQGYGVGLMFNSRSRLTASNFAYLDTIVNYLQMYSVCTCDIRIDEYNEQPDRINKKRIDKILRELNNRIDTSVININVYWQDDHDDSQFVSLFGLEHESLKRIQKTIDINVNCGNIFYVREDGEPFTGYHVWTINGKIREVTGFLKGMKHGVRFTWSYYGKLRKQNYENGKLVP